MNGRKTTGRHCVGGASSGVRNERRYRSTGWYLGGAGIARISALLRAASCLRGASVKASKPRAKEWRRRGRDRAEEEEQNRHIVDAQPLRRKAWRGVETRASRHWKNEGRAMFLPAPAASHFASSIAWLLLCL